MVALPTRPPQGPARAGEPPPQTGDRRRVVGPTAHPGESTLRPAECGGPRFLNGQRAPCCN
eukprot:1275701-Lingulodinium_polyedra.AAC.1